MDCYGNRELRIIEMVGMILRNVSFLIFLQWKSEQPTVLRSNDGEFKNTK